MKFTAKSESELDTGEWPLLPAGEYPFTTMKSDEVPSKSVKNKGKLMYALKLNVHGPKSDHHIFDFFAPWFSDWKLRHFAATTGMIAAYEAGELDGTLDKFAGKVGYVKIGIEPANGNFPAKNVVKDYIVRDAKAKEAAPAPPEDTSEVPF